MDLGPDPRGKFVYPCNKGHELEKCDGHWEHECDCPWEPLIYEGVVYEVYGKAHAADCAVHLWLEAKAQEYREAQHGEVR